MTKYSKISNYFIIIAFLIMIVTPNIMFYFLGDYISIETNENRELARKPEFSLENIANYSQDYENYYNDNLPFRSLLRVAWANLNFLCLNESSEQQVVIGKNEGSKASTWLFYQNEEDGATLAEVQGKIDFSEEQKNQIYSQISQTTEELSKRNIQTYFVMIPNKENLYKEMLPERIEIYNDQTRVDNLANCLQNECGQNNVIYIKDALLEAKKEYQVYDKQDSHWNDYGAFVGFADIVSKIEPEYKNLDCKVDFAEESIVYKDLTKMLGVKEILKDIIPTVEFLPDTQYATHTIETPTNSIVITDCGNAEIDKTLLVVGDSYRVGMIPYFSKVYKKVIYTHRCDYGPYMLSTYNPDVIISEYVERYVKDIPKFSMY